LQLVAARAALRLGVPADAERVLRIATSATALPLMLAYAELVRVELAVKQSDAVALASALDGASRAAEQCSSVALTAEVARLRDTYEGRSVVVTSRGTARMASFLDVCVLARSSGIVIEGGTRVVSAGDRVVSLARKPVLFDLLRVLAEHAPRETARDVLITRGFGARRPNASHRSRLRVELGRLRALLRGLVDVEATDAGYALRATREMTLVMPLEESEASRMLALMQRGEPWSASALAEALGVSPRTAQRNLVVLEASGKVASRGTGRGCRWVRLGEITTELLLPGPAQEP
jgi:DNA-binding transcriptional ArsR family regulator